MFYRFQVGQSYAILTIIIKLVIFQYKYFIYNYFQLNFIFRNTELPHLYYHTIYYIYTTRLKQFDIASVR